MKQQKNIYVVKRNNERELLDLNKFSRMVEEACEGLSGVSASQIEMKSGIQFYDGITTKEIQNILIRSASDLIDLETPNYQYVAARLLLYGLYKDVYNGFEPMPLKQLIELNIAHGVYDSEILSWYTDEEFYILQSYLRFDRDLNFTYAGLRQVYDKYLVQNRVTNEIYETPQFMYMLIALVIFHNYPKETRLQYVKKYYDAVSTFKISLPTPIMAGVRTPMRQYSSCTLIEIDDSLDSIFASNTAIGKYTAQRAGIGMNMGKIRGIGSKIRGGEVSHTGVLPFLKMLVATTRSCSQGNLRGGNSTIHFPIWHQEIEDIIVLKNNKGNDENRERRADYSIQLSKLFYQRYIDNGKISLFNPNEMPNLYESFGTDKFDEIYIKAEKDKLFTKQVSAKELFEDLLKERAETGRIYIQNLDHVNSHSPFNDKISMSNLCLSGDTLVKARIYNTEKDWDLQGVVQAVVAGHSVEVLSYNFSENIIEYKPITAAALTYKNAETYTVKTTKNTIIGTGNHPIYVNNKGWTEIQNLQVNDSLKTFNDEVIVTEIYKDKNVDVFDISVQDNHNFFANDILVHNCQEIALPTKPINDLHDDKGEIATCILSAINLGKINKLSELEPLCDLAVRALEETIDLQEYPIKAAENYTKRNRTLGIGYIGLAHYLAKNKVKYSDPNAWQLVHDTTEAFQYYLMNASAELAKEKGACSAFSNSKLANNILPIDTYKKDVDSVLIDNTLKMPWDKLREKIKKYGVRNLTVAAMFPSESSSICSNATAGLDCPRGYLSVKKSKKGTLKQIVPSYSSLKNYYTLLWDMPDMTGYINICATIQKFIDQSISANTSYDAGKWEGAKIPLSVFVKDILYGYKMGIKNWYYHNTNDGKNDDDENSVLPPLEASTEALEAEEDCEACKV